MSTVKKTVTVKKKVAARATTATPERPRTAARAESGLNERPKTSQRPRTSPAKDIPLGPSSENIRVFVRVRPLVDAQDGNAWEIDERSMRERDGRAYQFERVFDPSESTDAVYRVVADPIVAQCLRGFNGTIFAYGQTNSGKTHTMMGRSSSPGIIPLTIDTIFRTISESTDMIFLLRVSYIEIYNEDVNDLLDPLGQSKAIREVDGVFTVADLKEVIVSCREDVMKVIAQGDANRSVGKSNLNEHSSRSHSIFRMIIEMADKSDEDGGVKPGAVRYAELNLVDLAGSETLTEKFGAKQQSETKHINLSLTQLKTVIQSLSNNESFIPYRNSALTKILRTSLGGNARTSVICTASASEEHAKQTKMTLLFGSMAKTITNAAVVNETYDDSKALLKQYRKQINNLTRQLNAFEDIEKEKEKLQNDYVRLQAELEALRNREQSQQRLNDELDAVNRVVVGNDASRSSIERTVGASISDEQMDALNEQLQAIRLQNVKLEEELRREIEAKESIAADRATKMDELLTEKRRATATERALAELQDEKSKLVHEAESANQRVSEVEARAQARLKEFALTGVDRDGMLAHMIYNYEAEVDRLRREQDDVMSLAMAEKLMAEERETLLKREFAAKLAALSNSAESAARQTDMQQIQRLEQALAREREERSGEREKYRSEIAFYELQLAEFRNHMSQQGR